MTPIDPTDENTGLPPLDQPVEADTLWTCVFTTGQADVLSPIDGSPRGSLVVSVRGLVEGRHGQPPDWAQMHIAFPHGSISRLRDHLDAYLQAYPE